MSVSSIMSLAAAAAAAESSFLLDVAPQSYFNVNPGGDSLSGIRIATDRDVDQQQGAGAYTDRADWLEAAGTPSDYEVRATLNSGSLDAASDATGSYLALSSAREWITDDVQNANLTISIRRMANTNDEKSFTCALTSDNSPI